MRVIAGTYRGRKLSTVKSLAVRPTADRAKQVIFDVLSTRVDLDGVSILDIFAGSGSLGIEALSRGAGSVVFVERSGDALTVLEQNIRSLKAEGACERVRGDVYAYLRQARREFDVVFADPPYDLPGIEQLPDAIGRSGVIRRGGWLVMEHRSTSLVQPDPAMFAVVRKELGQTIALILHYAPQDGNLSEREP